MAALWGVLSAVALSLVAAACIAAACVWFLGLPMRDGGVLFPVIGGLGVGVATLLRVLRESLIGCFVGGLLVVTAGVCCHEDVKTHPEGSEWAKLAMLMITAYSAAGGFFLGMVYGLIRWIWRHWSVIRT